MIKLDTQKTLALAGIYESAGLQVVFDVFEFVVTESENALIGENPANKDAVTALHAVAFAQRAMLQSATQQIDYLVKEYRNPPNPSD